MQNLCLMQNLCFIQNDLGIALTLESPTKSIKKTSRGMNEWNRISCAQKEQSGYSRVHVTT